MQQNNNFDSQPMKKLVEVKLQTWKGRDVRAYRYNETKMGIHTPGVVPRIYNCTIDMWLKEVQKDSKSYRITELVHQVKLRELGNSYEVYETTKFSGRKWAGLA